MVTYTLKCGPVGFQKTSFNVISDNSNYLQLKCEVATFIIKFTIISTPSIMWNILKVPQHPHWWLNELHNFMYFKCDILADFPKSGHKYSSGRTVELLYNGHFWLHCLLALQSFSFLRGDNVLRWTFWNRDPSSLIQRFPWFGQSGSNVLHKYSK